MTRTAPRRRVVALVALLCAAFLVPAGAARAEEPPISQFTVSPSSSVAGAHGNLFVHLRLGSGLYPQPPAEYGLPEIERHYPEHLLNELTTALPPGLLADPTAVGACTDTEVIHNRCPDDAQVGVVRLLFSNGYSLVSEEERLFPLFNLVPGPEHVARLAFAVVNGAALVHLDVDLRDGSDYGPTITVSHISSALNVYQANVEVWGEPAASEHDGERASCYAEFSESFTCSASLAGSQTFLVNPPLCTPQVATASARFYDLPGEEPAAPTAPLAALTGCATLPFAPSLAFGPAPGQAAAEEPAAYDADLTLPQGPADEPAGQATAFLRDLTAKLPPGVSISPSAAQGLGACTDSELGLGSHAPATCPENSKVGTASVHSPDLAEELTGSVYVGSQESSDPASGSLYRLFLVLEGQGLRVKLAGGVKADPSDGRLTAAFAQNPEVPFDALHLDLNGGPRAPLSNPPLCGTYPTVSTFTPWSAPETPSHESTSSFAVTSGANGGPCAASEAALPFGPSFEAGTVDPAAGAFSPFVLKLSRADGSQRFSALTTTLPEGLLGRLAGIPYCSPAELAAAEAQTAAQATAAPACPAASEVGRVTTAVGPGPTPLSLGGRAYLSGPYEGAPLSLAFVVPAAAGPFDLGTVVVRAALQVNPETTQITVVSDPFPKVVGGVPIDLRSLAVEVDRPQFTLNPTDCKPTSVTAKALSQAGATGALGQPFAASGCGSLPFAPTLSLRLKGKSDRGAKPRLRAVLQTKPGGANIGRAQISLPHSEFLEQAHIKTVCTRAQFAADGGNGAGCPASSVYGRARAISPLLGASVEGPVYLRSSDHKLPDLVAALHGQVDIDLDGRIDSGANGGIQTTFETVPDAPVSKFVLEMDGGKKGLLVNSEDLCAKGARTTATARFRAQSGKVHALRVPLAGTCR